MRGTTWVHTNADHAAGGRRRYNAERAVDARFRRIDVITLLRRYGRHRGVQTRIANELGVSRSTVSRDIAAMLGNPLCYHCGGPTIVVITDPDRLMS